MLRPYGVVVVRVTWHKDVMWWASWESDRTTYRTRVPYHYSYVERMVWAKLRRISPPLYSWIDWVLDRRSWS